MTQMFTRSKIVGMLCLSSLLPPPTGLGLRYISAHVVGLVIGASLSEPHTSVDCIDRVVCMFKAIYQKFEMSVFKYFMKTG